MLRVIKIIKEYFDKREIIFVFPTEIIAAHMAEIVTLETGWPLPLERFISWDTFKVKTLTSTFSQEMVPANAIQRRLFISSLFKKNAALADSGEKALFADLIPPEWAENYESFIENTASLLPRLKPLKEKLIKLSPNNPYYRDLLSLLSDWESFIKERSIYEPSWERAPFKAEPFHWILIYPDLADDWEDYRTELSTASDVKIFTVQELIKSESPPAPLYSFQNQLEEFRQIARLVREDIDKNNLALEDIVVSVPKIEESISLLANEFALFDIPVSVHSGLPLAGWPIGDLFIRLGKLIEKHWSFPLLRDLLLDPRIPWKKDLPREELLLFGQRYCCLTGFKEKKHTVEVWGKTIEKLRPKSRIAFFWDKFKEQIFKITGAKDFPQLQQAILAFKYKFLDEEALSKNDDNVFARIIRELKSLKETIARLKPLEIQNPFGLLLAQLRATLYVPQVEDFGAIRIYPFRVAAGIQPKAHYILSAGQDALNVDSSPLNLFPEPLRKPLQEPSKESDLSYSELYLLAYRHSGEKVVFSYAKEDPSGFVIPHIGLLNPKLGVIDAGKPLPEDPWETEQNIALKKGKKENITRRASIQAESFLAWQKTLEGADFYRDFRKDTVEPKDLAVSLKANLVHQEKSAHLSPTDFNNIARCPFYWLLGSGLKLKELSTEIETIEQKEVGLIYHKILEELFLQMEEDRGHIHKNDEEKWLAVAEEKISEVLKKQEEKEGYFQTSIYAMLAPRILYSLRAFIKTFLEKVSPAKLVGVEIPLSWEDNQNNIPLFGKLDLVIKAEEPADSEHFLLDFKTNMLPKPKDLILDEGNDEDSNKDSNDEMLGNYQLASYIFLLEENKMPVEKASFYSLDKREYLPVVDPKGPRSKSSLPKTRANYAKEIESVEGFFYYSISLLEAELFPALNRDEREACKNCPYHPFCRINYLGEDIAEESYG